MPLPATSNCGNCRFAEMLIERGRLDVTKRVCKKLPPMPIALHAPDGIRIDFVFPQLPTDFGCHSFEPRPTLNVEAKPTKRDDIPTLPPLPGQPGERKN